MKRRRKRADGTYSAEESYHSSQDETGQERRKKRRQKRMQKIKAGGRQEGSDSEYSYRCKLYCFHLIEFLHIKYILTSTNEVFSISWRFSEIWAKYRVDDLF